VLRLRMNTLGSSWRYAGSRLVLGRLARSALHSMLFAERLNPSLRLIRQLPRR
jgi:hypothetical protein